MRPAANLDGSAPLHAAHGANRCNASSGPRQQLGSRAPGHGAKRCSASGGRGGGSTGVGSYWVRQVLWWVQLMVLAARLLSKREMVPSRAVWIFVWGE
jgi:hypothetical protein